MSNDGKFGPHVSSFEEPDLIFMKLVGKVEKEDGSAINRQHLEIGEPLDRLFYLIDMEQFDGVDAAVRKEAGMIMSRLPLRGIAVYKASFTARVVAKLIVGAMNVFKPSGDKAPLEAFESEEEARAWISRRRDELLEAAA